MPGSRRRHSLVWGLLLVTCASLCTSDAHGRLAAVNGFGEELELGRRMLAPAAPLAAWPLPYRGGALHVSFGAPAAFGGGAAPIELAIYDAAGRLVRTLAAGAFAPGHHVTGWDGRDAHGALAAPGLYFLRLSSENNARQVKIVVAP